MESVHIRPALKGGVRPRGAPSQRSGRKKRWRLLPTFRVGPWPPSFLRFTNTRARRPPRSLGQRSPEARPVLCGTEAERARVRRALRPRREVRAGGGASASPVRAPRRPAPRLPRNSAPCRSLTATSPAPGSGPTGQRSRQTRVSLLDMLALPSQDIRNPGKPPKGSVGHNYLSF